MRSSIVRAHLVVACAAAAIGCDAITGGKDPKITLRASATSATVGQGTSSTISIFVDRTKFDKTVNLTVEGAPAGVTAIITPANIDNGVPSSTLLITASPSAVPVTATLTVRGKGEGVPDQSLTVDLTITPTGAFALSPIEPSLTVAQGGGGVATIRILRSGNNGSNVTLAVSGLPAGVTSTVTESPTTSGSATLVLSATSGVATGSYTVTITGSSPGFTNQTTTVTVDVIAAPATATLTLPFCASDVPVWVAYKNDGFAWQQATPSGSVFSFAATSRLTVAFAFSSGGETQLNIFSMTRNELAASTDRDCAGLKSHAGSVAGLTVGQTARIAMGSSLATATTFGGGTFSINNVNSRPLDLIASKGQVSGDFFTPDRMIIRRSVDQATGSTIAALDFSAGESFAPATTTLTIGNFQSADQVEITNTFWSKTSTFSTAHSASITSATVPLLSVPAAQMVSGDLHELFIDAFQQSSSQVVGRSYVMYIAAPVDQTANMGPAMNTPTLTVLTSTPYTRFRGVVASQPEYDTSIRYGYFQGQQGASRFVIVSVSQAYLGSTPTNWDVAIPDLNGTQGFNVNWMPASGAQTSFFVEAFSGRTDLLFGALPAAGNQVRFAYRVAPVVISTLLRAGRGGRARAVTLPQYLRR